MAKRHIRYLVGKRGAGDLTRWYWQPSDDLRELGFRTVRIAKTDMTPWKTPAPGTVCDEAEFWNNKLDAWKKGKGPHPFEDDRQGGTADKPLAATILRKSTRPGTLNALIARYKAHRKFLELAPKTQRMYSGYLDILGEWAGDLHVCALDADMALEFYDELYPVTPTKANHTMTILRLLYSFAKTRGKTEKVPVNPFMQLGLEWKRGTARIWEPDEVKLFVEHADRIGLYSVGTACMLNEWIGQRTGDVLSFSRRVAQDGDLHFKQSKTGAEVFLPVYLVSKLVTRLDDEADRWQRRHLIPATLIASERTGMPYSDDAFSHVFREVREAAAEERPEMAELWFSRFRHTAVVRLGEANASTSLIAAITGHTLKTCDTILERYNVRTKKMAVKGFQLRLEEEEREAKE